MSILNNLKPVLLSSVIMLFTCASYAQNAVTDILKKHKWLTSSITSAKAIDLNNKGKKSTDLLAQSPDCTWDDVLLFKDNNVFIRDENKNKCSSIQTRNGSWSLLNKDSLAIKYSPELQPIKYRIILANNKVLVLTANMPFIPGGVAITYIYISND
jgi:hypothetical protein